jgi:hypothetical protein
MMEKRGVKVYSGRGPPEKCQQIDRRIAMKLLLGWEALLFRSLI